MIFLLLNLPANAEIRQSYKVKIPDSEIEKTWEVLKDNYSSEKGNLTGINESLKSIFIANVITEKYYNARGIFVPETGNSISHTTVVDLVEYSKKKKSRFIKKPEEYIVIRLSDINKYKLNLEVLCNTCVINNDKMIFEGRTYNAALDLNGKHPLIGHVRRKDRAIFIETIKKIGLEKPGLLKNVMNLTHNRAGFKIDSRFGSVGSVYLDKITADKFGIEYKYAILRFVPDSAASDNEKMLIIREKLIENIESLLPEVKVQDQSDYHIAFSKFRKNIPFYSQIMRYPVTIRFTEIILYSLLSFIVLLICFRKRLLNP